MLVTGHKSLIAAMLVLTLGFATRSACADSRREAADHFANGVRLIDGGNVQEGLKEFLRAYELSPNYTVLYNIAQARVDLHQYCQAQEALRSYLHEGGQHISKARRASVEKQIDDLEEEVGRLDVQVNVTGAVISVDGVAIGRSPLQGPIAVDSGEHVVSTTASGYLPIEQQVSLRGKQQVTLRWSLSSDVPSASTTPAASSTAIQGHPPPAPPVSGTTIEPTPVAQTPSIASDRKGTGGPQRGIGIAVSVLGLAGIGVGTGYAIRSVSKGNESDEHCKASGACDEYGIKLNRQAMDATTVSIVGFAAGGAALACGLTLILTAPSLTTKNAMHRRLWLSVATNGATLSGNW